MPHSLLSLLVYSIIAIRYYAAPKDEDPSNLGIWQDHFIRFILAAVILSCVPWLISDMSGFSEQWPKVLHYVVVGSVLLIGTFVSLLIRRKK